jgi:hypothetical protein
MNSRYIRKMYRSLEQFSAAFKLFVDRKKTSFQFAQFAAQAPVVQTRPGAAQASVV